MALPWILRGSTVRKDLRVYPFGPQLLGCLPGVTAEEPSVDNSIAAGIFFCVLNGLWDNLRPNDISSLPARAKYTR